MNHPKAARLYLRVSTQDQDLRRQEAIADSAREAGYYLAGVYREKASGASADRPELHRLIADLQPGDTVIAERVDRLTRLPLADAEQLVATIRAKGAKLAIPGLVDLSDMAAASEGAARIVLEAVQAMLLRLALHMARDDYETRRERQRQGIERARDDGRYRGRRPDARQHAMILALRGQHSIRETAELVGCSESQVKRIQKAAREGDTRTKGEASGGAGADATR